MTNWIELGGKNRPIRFGHAAQYEYELTTGRNSTIDLVSLSKPGSLSIKIMVDYVSSALIAGHSTEGVNIEFSKYDVADWILGSEEIQDKLMELINLSLPDPKNSTAPQKQKAKASQ